MRKSLGLTICFIMFIEALLGQSTIVDSLKIELNKSTSDSSRLTLLNKLSESYFYINTDSTIFYGNEALELAKQIGDREEEGAAYTNLCQGYIYASKYDKAENIAYKAIDIYDRLAIPVKKANVILKLGVIQKARGDYDSARATLYVALDVFSEHDNMNGMAKTNNIIGNIYQNQGDYPRASEYLHRSITQFQKAGNIGGEADATNNLGIVYEYLNERKKALNNYHKALQIFKKVDDELGFAIGMHNAGIILKKEGNYDSALYNFHVGYKKDIEIGAVDGIPYDMKEIGETHLFLGNIDSAYYYLKQAIKPDRQFLDPVVLVPSLVGLGKIFIKKNMPDSAELFLKEGYELSKKYELLNEEKRAAFALHEHYFEIQQYKIAIEYLRQYDSLKNLLFGEESISQLAVAEAKFNYEKEKSEGEHEMELERAERDKMLADEIWFRNIVIMAMLLVLVLTGLVFFNYQQKRKDHAMLLELNEQINEQKDELSQKTEELVSLNDSLNKLNASLEQKVKSRTKALETSKIKLEVRNKQLQKKNETLANYAFFNAHKLRAPVASILGLVDLFLKPEINEKEKEEIIHKITKETGLLNTMLKEIQDMLDEE